MSKPTKGPHQAHPAVRPMLDSDVPILESWRAKTPFPYVEFDCPTLEGIWVLADHENRPLMAVMANRLVEIYLLAPPTHSIPAQRFVHAMRLFQDAAEVPLWEAGYSNVEAFLPPTIAQRFGRRLERTFGWVRNWPSWSKRL